MYKQAVITGNLTYTGFDFTYRFVFRVIHYALSLCIYVIYFY